MVLHALEQLIHDPLLIGNQQNHSPWSRYGVNKTCCDLKPSRRCGTAGWAAGVQHTSQASALNLLLETRRSDQLLCCMRANRSQT